MRVTLLAILVLYSVDLAFFHGDVSAELFKTASRISRATFMPPLS